MKVTVDPVVDRGAYEFLLDGRPLLDVVSADEEAGEITYLARHWQTGDLVYGSDGLAEELTARGKVEIRRTAVMPAPVQQDTNAWGPKPIYPCPSCGGGCGDYCQMCCLSAPSSERDAQILDELLPLPESSGRRSERGKEARYESIMPDLEHRSQCHECGDLHEDCKCRAFHPVSCSLCGRSPWGDYWTSLPGSILCSECLLQLAENVREALVKEAPSVPVMMEGVVIGEDHSGASAMGLLTPGHPAACKCASCGQSWLRANSPPTVRPAWAIRSPRGNRWR